ncbi:unnamed protein product [Lupinus luteus]|uniref:Uncharacterized protein n=1 Tax=Lupinus luteus TaxID=3873 RepID=A0AAV1WIK6_LUPLU
MLVANLVLNIDQISFSNSKSDLRCDKIRSFSNLIMIESNRVSEYGNFLLPHKEEELMHHHQHARSFLLRHPFSSTFLRPLPFPPLQPPLPFRHPQPPHPPPCPLTSSSSFPHSLQLRAAPPDRASVEREGAGV